MTPQQASPRLPLEAWRVETLRTTLFPSPTTSVDPSTWWVEVVGEEADTQIVHRKKSERREEGLYKDGKLVLHVQPIRIDWIWAAQEEPEGKEEDFPSLGSFPAVCPLFTQLMDRWLALETCPNAQRLAFGAILLYPVPDRATGYRQLMPYLPAIQLDPERSSDFLYRINRRRPSTSGIPHLEINRLATWSVMARQLQPVSISPEAVGYFPTPPRSFACRIELDINTAPEFREELSRDQFRAIFHELVHLGQEIATEGDIS